eukprot:g6760.t1
MGGCASGGKKDDVVDFTSPKANGMVAPSAEVIVQDFSSLVILSLRCEGLQKGRSLGGSRKPRDPPIGKLFIYAEESVNAKAELSFSVSGQDLKPTDFWKRKCDPYFVVNRIQAVYESGEIVLQPIFRSEVARKSSEPSFEEASFTVAQTSGCDTGQDIIITVHDWIRLGNHGYIGEFEVMSVYDNDNCYPIYGFGAKIPPTHSVVSNCFALTGDFFQPEVEGRDVVKLAADMSRPYIQPKNPKMNERMPDMKYYVLVVLTDGEIEEQYA